MKKRIKHIIHEENFLSLAGNLLIAMFGIGSFALLARTLHTADFGQWVLFVAAGSFVEMFRFGITNTALLRFLSGADENTRTQLKGSNALIGLVATSVIAALLFICNLTFHRPVQQSGYGLFFTWYPLLAFVNLFWNNALVILQASRCYGKILVLKAISSGSFFIVLIVNLLFFEVTLESLVWSQLIINTVTSLVSILNGWDGLADIKNVNKQTCKSILHFGKYTTFTLIGTNLLRNADTFIISLSPLGGEAIALYSIPLKLTELQQVPLRSFAATAFPKLSKASMQQKSNEVKALFYNYAGALSYLFIFVSLFTFFFADFFVLLLAGKQYLQYNAALGCSAPGIVRIFSVYGMLLPIDRMTGITLDSINRPHVNAVKVLLMLLANIAGDLVAVFIFNSLLLVAIASILFTITGIWLGMYFLNKELDLKYSHIFLNGAGFYKQLLHKAKHKQPADLMPG